MAKIFCSKELVIITVNETIFFFDFEYHDYQLNLLFKKAVSIDFVPKIATDSQNNLDVDCSDQGKTVNCEEKLGDNKDKSVDKQLDKQILGGSFSDDGTLFAVITAQKACIVYRTEGERLKLAQFILPKAPTSVVFDKTGEHVIVADRAGNVTRYRIKPNVDDNFQKAGEVLLGHCSMVLCVAISSCGNYICSSDRDEKIRISRYPESYVICQFCLGHTSYVSCVAVIYDMIFSSGGDGSIKVWNIENGQEQCSCDLFERKKIRIFKIDMNRSSNDFIQLGVVFENSEIIEIIKYDVLKKEFVRSAKLIAKESVMDLEFLPGKGLITATRSGIWFYSGKNGDVLQSLRITTSELSYGLREAKDVPLTLEKKLGFSNLQDYQQRKAERLSKRKRKYELSDISL